MVLFTLPPDCVRKLWLFLWAWLPRARSLCHSSDTGSVGLYLLHKALGSVEWKGRLNVPAVSCATPSPNHRLNFCPFWMRTLPLWLLISKRNGICILEFWLLKCTLFLVTLTLAPANVGFLRSFLYNRSCWTRVVTTWQFVFKCIHSPSAARNVQIPFMSWDIKTLGMARGGRFRYQPQIYLTSFLSMVS